MGHKVNPRSFRLGIIKTWNSKWFGRGRAYAKNLREDVRIRKYIEQKFKEGGVTAIEIERSPDSVNVIIQTAKPGVVIGRGGAGVDQVKKDIEGKILKNKKSNLQINIKEVDKPMLQARIIAQNIAQDLEKRIPFRRSVKRMVDQVMKAGAQGVKIMCSGRLNGAEIARTEIQVDGKVPLHTLRADIDYSPAVARTTYGAVGVKVWVYRGEIFDKKNKSTQQQSEIKDIAGQIVSKKRTK